MKSKRITYSKLVNYLTKQPYLVWNSLDMEIDESNDSDDFDFDDFNDAEMETTSISQVQAKMFEPIEKAFVDKILKKDKSVLINGKSVEERYIQTVEAIHDHEVDVIINATFIVEVDGYEVVARISKLNQKTGKMSNLKLSTSTKLKDIIKFYFDYAIFNKWQNSFKIKDFNEKYGQNLSNDMPKFEIDEASIFVIRTKLYKKGEVSFFESFKINSNKSGRSDSEAMKNWDFDIVQAKKTGNGKNARDKKDELFEIIDYIDGGSDDDIRKKMEDWDGFKSIDFYIIEIIDYDNAKKYPLSIPGPRDNQIFGAEKEFKEILSLTNSPFAGWSNNVIPKDTIITYNYLNSVEELVKREPDLVTLKEIYSHINESYYISQDNLARIGNELINVIDNGINVWYDFEGFSLSVCPLEGLQPFQQVVPQVSIITTKGVDESIGHATNIVLDPLFITNDYFVEIIDAIYNKDATSYIVFNKGYENARLSEMVNNLEKLGNPKAKECAVKVEEIIEKTIDLAIYFSSSKSKCPVVLLPSLKGMYSIKKIEKYITENHKDLLKMKYSNVEYKSLEVRNGAMAMDILNNRALGIIGTNVWNDHVESLKLYCENDVKSMITVYYLIKKLYKIESARRKDL